MTVVAFMVDNDLVVLVVAMMVVVAMIAVAVVMVAILMMKVQDVVVMRKSRCWRSYPTMVANGC